MFKKILIANRGEIACRVMKTARRMGIATVAVYSDADAGALHVQMADEAVRIGGAASSESYLVIDRILEAIRQTGAEAVHPGYGFLSENARFAEALEAEGIAFIGPGIRAIGAMGDKIESKKLANAAGVSTVPGHLGVLTDDDDAVKVAGEIGYPVMIKASAGGGGKGMRVAYSDTEAREGFRSAVSEALSSFGDDRVFIEKFVEEPRHIEIQVLADGFGNTVHLGERECSIQRRHQKVIEEAPSPFLDEATRRAMGAEAVALSKAVDYRSAGTVEFIVDKDRNFYFLEMNTRLQVEHPVTECITGLDLVEQMIRIANGEKLAFTQDDVKFEGWAVESRIYAEDPYRGFLPSTGRLVRYQTPDEVDGVRIDTGVGEGAEISMFYDPMIAKLVTSGGDRAEAIDKMAGALDRFRIRGVGHNVDFLAAVMAHPRFREGRLSTGFIAEEFPSGFDGAVLSEAAVTATLAVAAAFEWAAAERAACISGQVALAHRAEAGQPSDRSAFVIRDGDARVSASVTTVDGGYDVVLDGAPVQVRGDCGPIVTVFDGKVAGRPVAIQIERDGTGYRISHGGAERRLQVISARVSAYIDLMPVKQAPDMSRFLLSPMPGLLVSVAVSEGEAVKAGQELAVVEAMKMENVMRAERDGVVSEIHAVAGASLAVDQPIIEFE
jgi:propionyl-CoA carboxylase alpha chain